MGKTITISPEQFQEKYARNLKNSTTDIRRGVEAVTVSPGVEAAKQIQKMRDNFNAAIENGKTKRALENIDLQDWKNKMINIGISRIAAGVDAAKEKTIDFATKLLDYEQKLLTEINKMAKVTLQDSKARMDSWFEGMVNFRK